MVESVSENEKIQNLILQTLDKAPIADTFLFSQEQNATHAVVEPVLKSLLVDNYVVLDTIERKSIALTEEGKEVAEKGTPEYQIASSMELNAQTKKKEIEAKIGAAKAKIGFSQAMKRKWLK